MLLAGSLKFFVATWLFGRSVIKAIIEYTTDDEKRQNRTPPSGVGLEPQELPKDLPSVVEIKRSIPRHCLDPKVSTSMYYALKDAALVALTFAAIHCIHQVAPLPIWYVALFFYWCVQGTFFTSIFVIGHDCGHGSFSHYSNLNDIVGTIWHGFLLCPYYMWKISHRNHHKNNANFDRDEVFYPVKKSEPCAESTVLPGFGFGVGWFGYLILGYKPRAVPHFSVGHPMYQGHKMGTLFSIGTCLVWAACLYQYVTVYGFWAWFNYYFVPLFIFASYCVIITFLHHTEVNIPWYADQEWDFVRGQLSTVDRHYGIVHHVLHSIGTHQMHHMFTKIPHYHLEEATQKFRQNFPQLVRICEEPILPSFMRMFKKYMAQGKIEDDIKKHVYH